MLWRRRMETNRNRGIEGAEKIIRMNAWREQNDGTATVFLARMIEEQNRRSYEEATDKQKPIQHVHKAKKKKKNEGAPTKPNPTRNQSPGKYKFREHFYNTLLYLLKGAHNTERFLRTAVRFEVHTASELNILLKKKKNRLCETRPCLCVPVRTVSYTQRRSESENFFFNVLICPRHSCSWMFNDNYITIS